MQRTISTQFTETELKELIVEAIKETIPPPPEKLFTATEAAEYLGITKTTLHSWKSTGKIQAFWIGKILRYKQTELDRMLTKAPRLEQFA